MKYCINCGSKINSSDKICHKCSNKEPKDKNLLILLLIVLVPLVFFSSYFFIKRTSIKKAKGSLVNNYVINETNNQKVKVKYEKEFNCTECSMSCDGSCFWYGKISECTINKYTVTNNKLKYTAYYINDNGTISYISDYDEVKIYNDLEAELKNNFEDYDLKISYKNNINKTMLNTVNKISIEMKKYGDIEQVYTERLHNILNNYYNKYEKLNNYSTSIELNLIYGRSKYMKIYSNQGGNIHEKYSDGSSVDLPFDFYISNTYEKFLNELKELSI